MTLPEPPSNVATLPVAEVFGPTFQGEGRSAGRVAGFIRLGGCNLTCNKCDSGYTWDASRYDLRAQLTNRSPADIMQDLHAKAGRVPLVVLTGGEPLLYQHRRAFEDLVTKILHHTDGCRIEVETNGTIEPLGILLHHQRVSFNVSPKLAGPMSDDPDGKRIVPAALERFSALGDRAVFKVVVRTPDDVDQAAALARTHGITPDRVWIMPEGNDPDRCIATMRAVADHALNHRFNLTARLHVLLWPTTDRGR